MNVVVTMLLVWIICRATLIVFIFYLTLRISLTQGSNVSIVKKSLNASIWTVFDSPASSLEKAGFIVFGRLHRTNIMGSLKTAQKLQTKKY